MRVFREDGRLNGIQAAELDAAVTGAIEAMLRRAVDEGFEVRDVEALLYQAVGNAADSVILDRDRHVTHQAERLSGNG